MNHSNPTEAGDPVDDAVVAYLEAEESGQTPDRAGYPQLAEFFADSDDVRRWTAPLRGAALPRTVSSGGPRRPAQLASFGDYEVLEELGHGGMGVVFKARQRSLNREVALKIMLRGRLALQEDVRRFHTEAEAVARLQHPGIVQIFAFGEHEGCPYFAMECVEGGSLAARLKGPPPSDQEAAQLVEMLARSAHYAHGRNIVHRDLKPGNVLLTVQGVPKIADFGLAKFLDGESDQTHSDAVLGTPSYMAPELAEGKGKRAGPSADVYALGAILYELLTGRPPFRGPTSLDTRLLILEQPPVPPHVHNPRVDRALEAVCLKCLRKMPGERYPSAEALADDLECWRKGEPVRADQGKRLRSLVSPLVAMLRETRYTEVMQLWSGVWMGMAVLYLLICLAKSLFLWYEITDHGPFFSIWAAKLVADVGLIWFCRIRGKPPLTQVERQMCQIWAIFWLGFFLTAWQYWLASYLVTDPHPLPGPLPIAGLLPILVLEAAIAFGCMATLLGGSFYVMMAACVGTAILEACLPRIGPLISGAACAPALFWLGWKWKYFRRSPGG